MTHPIIFFHIPGIPDYVTLTVFVIILLTLLARMMLKNISLKLKRTIFAQRMIPLSSHSHTFLQRVFIGSL